MNEQLINPIPGIYRVVDIDENRSYVEMLFDGNQMPVQFGYIGTTSEVNLKINTYFPNLRSVSKQDFLAELEHIKIFLCRSDAPEQTPPNNLQMQPEPLDPPSKPTDPWLS